MEPPPPSPSAAPPGAGRLPGGLPGEPAPAPRAPAASPGPEQPLQWRAPAPPPPGLAEPAHPSPPPRARARPGRGAELRPELLVAAAAAVAVLMVQVFAPGLAADEPAVALSAAALAAGPPAAAQAGHEPARTVLAGLDAALDPQVAIVHGDVRTVLASTAFAEWRQRQASSRRTEIKRILHRGTPGEVIALLDEYKRRASPG